MTATGALRNGLLGASAALAIVGPAAAAAPEQAPGRCIYSREGSAWIAHDDHSIVVREVGRSFLVTTNSCPRLGDPLTHIIVDAPGGTPICGPHDARLYVSGGNGASTPCFMQSLKPLSQDEARQLERRQR